jgi:hypothetical protein
MIASVLGGVGLRVASMTSISTNRSKDNSRYESVGLAGERGSSAGDHSLVGNTAAVVTRALTPTPAPFSHPLVFPPLNTNGNISIGIDGACVQIGMGHTLTCGRMVAHTLD